MPNIYVLGLTAPETRTFSRLAADFFERELSTPRDHVYVFHQEATLFRDGEEAPVPPIIRVSWIRRPAEQFERTVAGLTRIVQEEIGRTSGPVQIELHEKWDDAAVDGRLCGQWAAANRS